MFFLLSFVKCLHSKGISPLTVAWVIALNLGAKLVFAFPLNCQHPEAPFLPESMKEKAEEVGRVLPLPWVQNGASTHLPGPVAPEEEPKKRAEVRGQGAYGGCGSESRGRKRITLTPTDLRREQSWSLETLQVPPSLTFCNRGKTR